MQVIQGQNPGESQTMSADNHTSATEIAGTSGELKRTLGPIQLISLGIGAIIGAGIFVITGTAAAEHAGPAIVISFIIASFGCVAAGLCYAELAAMMPFSGSAYTYAYAAFGRFAAWIIGWDLVLEYAMAASTVSVGWSGYFKRFMANLGAPPPDAFSEAPFTTTGGLSDITTTGAIINLPAVGIIAFLSALLVVGIRTSATINGIMVLIKVGIVLMVIGFGLPLIQASNLDPFIPPSTGPGQFGWDGILTASGIIFFAYIGFDAVSVAAQEARNPQRDLPIGILGSLAICTVLYILMALTMTGLAHYTTLNVPNPVSVAIGSAPSLAWLEPLVNLGAVAGLSTVILVSLYGQTRIFHAMAVDGFLPPVFAKVHPAFSTPVNGTILVGIFAAVFGGLFPIGILGELVSIGTLLAFVLVCLGVIVLRSTRPNAKRPFVTPFYPLVPLVGIGVCGYMMYKLPGDTWERLAVWFIIGMIIFAFYGARHAKQAAWKLDDAGEKSK